MILKENEGPVKLGDEKRQVAHFYTKMQLSGVEKSDLTTGEYQGEWRSTTANMISIAMQHKEESAQGQFNHGLNGNGSDQGAKEPLTAVLHAISSSWTSEITESFLEISLISFSTPCWLL